jgi:hypothetical protein
VLELVHHVADGRLVVVLHPEMDTTFDVMSPLTSNEMCPCNKSCQATCINKNAPEPSERQHSNVAGTPSTHQFNSSRSSIGVAAGIRQGGSSRTRREAGRAGLPAIGATEQKPAAARVGPHLSVFAMAAQAASGDGISTKRLTSTDATRDGTIA